MLIGKGYTDRLLTETEVRDLVAEALAQVNLAGKRVLVIIPDATRTAPISLFFRLFHEVIGPSTPSTSSGCSGSGCQVVALDYLVALGTHQPLSEEALNRLVGITAEERATKYADVRIFNHRWDLPETFATLGTITERETRNTSAGMLALDVPVRINRIVLNYDLLVICGPVFPHEVVGFSGGNKYFFPGIAGPEIINFTHWLGALLTCMAIIGSKHTPVRAVIDRAASFIDRPKLCFSLVVAPGNRTRMNTEGHGLLNEKVRVRPRSSASHTGLAGLYIGTPEEAWEAAADLSAKLHIVYVDRPFRRVLSVMPKMYDDLWVAAKGMYKLEPVVADGGEVIIYASHISEVSYTHGQIIDQIGYHVRDYFVKQWERFKHYPWGVLAHSTHLRGVGTYDAETGVERPRIKVTLATGIPRQRCERINLGYLDPATIEPAEWEGREEEGVLLVPKAGEMLYRMRS